jgi:hypothetical protein
MVPARPFLSGRPGCVRSSAWIWLFFLAELLAYFSLVFPWRELAYYLGKDRVLFGDRLSCQNAALLPR